MTPTRRWQVLILLSLTAITLYLLLTRPEPEAVLRPPPPVAVVTSAVQRVDLYPEETVSGYLRPVRRAWLHFEVEGRVAQRLVEPGQSVEAGEVLLRLDERDYADALSQAEAEWRQAQEELERDRKLLKLASRSRALQEEEVARLKSLGERSLTSKTRLGDALALLAQRRSDEARLQSKVTSAPQRLAVRKALLDRARRNLERTRLTAPFRARVNEVALQVGDFASRNQQAVELISAQLEFYTQVRGAVAWALKPGERASVEVAGASHPARVVAVQPDPDPETFTHAVRLSIPASETRVGALARARLPLPPRLGVLAVPATAVLLDEGGAYVFRLRDGRLQRLPVRTGIRVGEQQVILSGVAQGDELVVRDVAALADGERAVAAPADAE
ncbi:MAG TPA: efflux RND transporter periplasmic adaptor subunit [Gammaproteobacteria bacterium]|nr:efflux RND transporter periplasmic adaptor subunit [Gammaproteobacteria bacterium]